MALNLRNYRPSEPKSLPVVLLLDVSGSMYGAKIEALHDAVVEMVNTFVKERVKETSIKTSIITFGEDVSFHKPGTVDAPYTDVVELQTLGIPPFDADGSTPLGSALRLAKDMIEDKSLTPGKWYAPAVVLVSDGQPNDEWRQPLDAFIHSGRTARCQRVALAIGNDADQQMLELFTGNKNMVFFAEDAANISNAFKKVTMSVSQRASQSNPDGNLPKGQGQYDPTTRKPSVVKPSRPRPAITQEDDEEDF